MTPSTNRSPRKQPKQDRSRAMRDRILAASLRVLAEEGALGFTTTRVADEADVSVGSLYQYFPNKHALVRAIHDADIAAGWNHVQTLLDGPLSPRAKVAAIVEWFFITESEEVRRLGSVGKDIHVFLGDSINDPELSMLIIERLARFIAASSNTKRNKAELRFAADFAFAGIESIGKTSAARQLKTPELMKWARATSSMLCDALDFVVDATPSADRTPRKLRSEIDALDT
jgi:AcrR family transcriptional regulator